MRRASRRANTVFGGAHAHFKYYKGQRPDDQCLLYSYFLPRCDAMVASRDPNLFTRYWWS